MKNTILTVHSLITMTLSYSPLYAQQTSSPNIVLINIDDLG